MKISDLLGFMRLPLINVMIATSHIMFSFAQNTNIEAISSTQDSSHLDQVNDVSFSKFSQKIYSTSYENSEIAIYDVGNNGSLSYVGSESQTGAYKLTLSDDERFLFLVSLYTTQNNNDVNKLSSYRINTNGTLTFISETFPQKTGYNSWIRTIIFRSHRVTEKS